MLEKSSKELDLSASAEASLLVRRCAEPASAGESIKALMNKAARLTGLNPRRIKSLWYAEETSRVHADEMDRLRAVAAKQERALYAAATERRELRELLAKRSDQADALLRVEPKNEGRKND